MWRSSRKTIPYEMLYKITSLRHSRLSSAIHHFANCMCVCQGRSNFRDCHYVYTESGPCECSLAVQTNNMASVFSGWVNVCYLQKHFLCLLLLCSFQFPAKRYFTNKLPRPPVFNWWRQRVPPTETREEMNILLWHVWPPTATTISTITCELSLSTWLAFVLGKESNGCFCWFCAIITNHPPTESIRGGEKFNHYGNGWNYVRCLIVWQLKGGLLYQETCVNKTNCLTWLMLTT